jgi:hypothetical protein
MQLSPPTMSLSLDLPPESRLSRSAKRPRSVLLSAPSPFPISFPFSILLALVHLSFRGIKGPYIPTEFQLDFEPDFATEHLHVEQLKCDSRCLSSAVQFVGEGDFSVAAMPGKDFSAWKPRHGPGFHMRVFVIGDAKNDDGNSLEYS